MGDISKKIQEEVKEKLKGKKRRVYFITAILSVLLLLSIAFSFRMTGIAMESKLICTVEDHTHIEACYELEKPLENGENENPKVEDENKSEGEKPQVETDKKPESEKPQVEEEKKPEGEKPQVEDGSKPEGEKPQIEEEKKPEVVKPPVEDGKKPESEKAPGETTKNPEIPEEGKGHVNIKIVEDIPEGITINARVVFLAKGEHSNAPYSRKFNYEIKDKDGKIKESGIAEFKELSWDGKDGGYLFKGLEKGDSLKILNVPETEIIYSDKKKIAANIIANASNEFYPVIYEPGDELDIKGNETLDVNLSIGEMECPKIETNTTFRDIGGKYEVNYILQNYNILSFEDVVGTHIVGPIIAQNTAYRTAGYSEPENPVDPVAIGDYSKGIPSYVGRVDKVLGNNSPKVNANYSYDIGKNAAFRKPFFYVNTKDNMLRKEGELHYFFTEKGEKYLGSNALGTGNILQNDKFIDFENMRKQVNSYGSLLANLKDNVEVYPDPKTGIVDIPVGRDYVIKDASKLAGINFIYPEPYDPISNPFPVETIINITDTHLLKSGVEIGGYTYPKINGEVYYYFPDIYVNNVGFSGSQGQGEGFEYGTSNNIIINIPNAKTDNGGHRMTRRIETDILAHIIAPNLEFWNYSQNTDGTLNWEGGNINGCAIVDSWHGGKMEGHMWPYKPEALPIDLSFTKKDLASNNTLKGAEFEIIEVQSASDHRPLLGAEPKRAVSDENGIIRFTELESYSVYKLTEVKAPDGYHNPEGYWIVEITGYGSTLNINITPYGNVPSIGEDLVITNKNINFAIHKTDQVTNELLPGAVFDLYLADEKGQPTGKALIENITTGDDGKVSVSSNLLRYDTLYVLVETKAPEGYISKGNIPFYIMGTEGLYTDVSNKVAIGSDGVLTVTNAKEGYIMPETGGQGPLIYYLLGASLMIGTIILINKRKIIN